MIAIVDYGAGNPVSVKKALDWLGQESVITSDPQQVAAAARIILPGVGNFAATINLQQTGLKDAIAYAIGRGTPFLGICVGMQWLFEGSREAPETPGLGFFYGECERLPSEVKAPHVGWNRIDFSSGSRLLRDIAPQSFVYFTHSYRAPLNGNRVASCSYGGVFSAAVQRNHVFGVQFHPEKSAKTGLKLLENFCAL